MHADLAPFLTALASVSVDRIVPFDPQLVLHADDVLIGCGRHDPADAPGSAGLVLNNKGTERRFGRVYGSVAEMLQDPPAGLLDTWSLWAARPLAPAEALARMRLVAEDMSPDSVFGVLLLLARLANVDPAAIPAVWIEAVRDWETTGNADDPFTSWCALASALGHRHIPVGAALTAAVLVAAWTDVLRFAATCLLRGISPDAVPKLPVLPQWRRAEAALGQEQRVYLDWLPHATVVQLSLPLEGAPDRRLLVDGLIFSEDQVTGTAKVLYRNDLAHSPLGKGFTLAAHHRPSEAGTGNDITIAVDTRRFVHLRELRAELERREDAAWADAGVVRPSDRPRELHGVAPHANEPWFITPDGTLIGAPRRLADGQPGSRLSWGEVRDAIWTVFSPLRGVAVAGPAGGSALALTELRAEPMPPSAGTTPPRRKALLVAIWPRGGRDTGGTAPRALSTAPTVTRMLAGLIARRNDAPLGLDALPSESSWDKVSLSGGFAVVSNDGVLLLDDWRDRALDIDRLRETFEGAAALDAQLQHLEETDFGPLVADLRDILGGRHGWRETEEVVQRAAQLGGRLAGLRAGHATPPEDPDARAVYDAMGRAWALERRLAAIEAAVKSAEVSLRSLGELRTGRVTRAIAVYGFPLVLANYLSDPLTRALNTMLRGAPPEQSAPGVGVLLCFAAIATAAWLAISNAIGTERSVVSPAAASKRTDRGTR